MYTYVLYDKKYDIYKIGRTSTPVDRFIKLGILDRIYPVALFPTDIELQLHHEFAENRVRHPEENEIEACTEYFEKGGKFTAFVDKVNENYKPLPYLTISSAIRVKEDNKTLILRDPLIRWALDDNLYSYHKIGLKVLQAMGKVGGASGSNIDVKDDENIMFVKGKLGITDRLYHDIAENIVIELYDEIPAKSMLPEKFKAYNIRLDTEVVVAIISRK